MTNCLEISDAVQTQRDGSHEHQRLLGGRAKHAQRYPKELCRAMCAGLVKEIGNQAMSLHTAEDKAPGGGWAMDDLTRVLENPSNLCKRIPSLDTGQRDMCFKMRMSVSDLTRSKDLDVRRRMMAKALRVMRYTDAIKLTLREPRLSNTLNCKHNTSNCPFSRCKSVQ